jgi:integrase
MAIVKRGTKYSVVITQGRDPITGKQKQQWHSGYRTKKEAEHAETEFLHSLNLGTYVPPSKTTVGEFLLRWLDYTRPNVSSKTFVRYEEVVKKRLIPDLGSVPLRKLTPSHILKARALWASLTRYGRPLASQTLLHYHRVLYSALDRALKWQELAVNPCAAVDPPRVVRHAIEPLNVEQSRALLAVTAQDQDFGPVVALALLTGMRIGEVTGLQWQDVDWDRKTLSVRRSVQKLKGYGLLVKEPKTRRSRTVTLSDQAITILKRTRAHQDEQRLKLGPAYVFEGFVFATPEGTPLDAQAVRRHFAHLLGAAGVPRVRFHDLRHTHATLLLAQGVHAKVVSERLGHSNIGITLDTYSHVLQNLQEDAARKLDTLLTAEAV